MHSPNVTSSLGGTNFESYSRGLTTQRSIEGMTSHRLRTNHSSSTKGVLDINSVRHKVSPELPGNFTKTLKPEILVKNMNVSQDDFYTKSGGLKEVSSKDFTALKNSQRLNAKDHFEKTSKKNIEHEKGDKKSHLNSRKSQKEKFLKTCLIGKDVSPFVNYFGGSLHPNTTKN